MPKNEKCEKWRLKAKSHFETAEVCQHNTAHCHASLYFHKAIHTANKIPIKKRTNDDFRRLAAYLWASADNNLGNNDITYAIEALKKYREALSMLKCIDRMTVEDMHDIEYLKKFIKSYNQAIQDECKHHENAAAKLK